MVPFSRIDGILSVFSLEYLDLISEKIKTYKKSLVENFLTKDINDYETLFKY